MAFCEHLAPEGQPLSSLNLLQTYRRLEKNCYRASQKKL